MSLHQQLLDQARFLLRREARRPLQASLRRAVSASYYAVFHFLIDRATCQMFGSSHNRRKLRDILSRAFDRGAMRDASRSFAGGQLPDSLRWQTPIPAGLRLIADNFNQLQDERHRADYDRADPFVRNEVAQLLTLAEEVFRLWPTIEADDASQLYLACLLSWKSLRSR
jgi:hypothetical protein